MKNKQTIRRILDAALGLLLGVLLIGAFVFSGFEGLAKSNPRVALALGEHLAGTVQSKDRTLGFAITVNTQNYGDIQVSCSAEQYDTLSIGDTVTITCDLTIKE